MKPWDSIGTKPTKTKPTQKEVKKKSTTSPSKPYPISLPIRNTSGYGMTVNQNLHCVVFYDALERRAFSIIEILGRKYNSAWNSR
jgi:hypothetical protein